MSDASRRRRRLFFGAMLVVVIGFAYWAIANRRLNPDERRLVGTWEFATTNQGSGQRRLILRSNRTMQVIDWENTDVDRQRPFVSSGDWKVIDSEFYFRQDRGSYIGDVVVDILETLNDRGWQRPIGIRFTEENQIEFRDSGNRDVWIRMKVESE